jgi:hypothetical protein
MDIYEGDETCTMCEATLFEIIDERKGEDLIRCVFCGCDTKLRPTLRKKQPKKAAKISGDFRFQYGRFKGMTIEEVDSEPNGRRYLEWAASDSEKLRPRIEEFLRSNATPFA